MRDDDRGGILIAADRPLPRGAVAVGGEQAQRRGVLKRANPALGPGGGFDLAGAQALEQFHFEMVVAFAQARPANGG